MGTSQASALTLSYNKTRTPNKTVTGLGNFVCHSTNLTQFLEDSEDSSKLFNISG